MILKLILSFLYLPNCVCGVLVWAGTLVSPLASFSAFIPPKTELILMNMSNIFIIRPQP